MIVTEKGRGPQTGDYVEQVGTYDARSDEYNLKPERIEHWLSVGAQPSDTVHNLLVKAEVIDDDTVNPLPKKSPIVSESDEEEEADDEEGSEEGEDDSADEEEVDDDSASEDEGDDEAEEA